MMAGCHEALDPAPRPLPVVAPDGHLAQLVVTPGPAAGSWTVHVTLAGGAAAPRVGGFRARLVLPPELAVDGEVADQRGAEGAMMRAVRQDGGTVHAAGAAAEGVADGDLFVVTVRGAAEALAQLRLELEELVDVRGADRRARAVVSPRMDDRRIRR
ncbi:MAG: hypothetical protein KJT01_03800 [Gemmatimonadetes bacterium]|nr:hypothetical protein [Gemmatimonadota bacterium]